MTIARLRRFVLPAKSAAVGGSSASRPRGWRRSARLACSGRGEKGGLPGPSLDGNPVLWCEWHRSRPSRMTQILWGLYWLGRRSSPPRSASTTCSPTGSTTSPVANTIHIALVLQSVLGVMLPSVQRDLRYGEERVRGSLDVLMASPMSTRAIVWGKWMGTYRLALGLAVLPGVAAAVIAAASPDVLGCLRAARDREPDRAGRRGRSRAGARAGRRRAALLGAPRSPAWGCCWRPGPRGSAAPIGTSLARLPAALRRLVAPGRERHPAARCALRSTPAIGDRGHRPDPWIGAGACSALSPVAAPIATIQALESADAGRWQFWALMSLLVPAGLGLRRRRTGWCCGRSTAGWAESPDQPGDRRD